MDKMKIPLPIWMRQGDFDKNVCFSLVNIMPRRLPEAERALGLILAVRIHGATMGE
ncbi:hypothetical protein [Spirosoma areae]